MRRAITLALVLLAAACSRGARQDAPAGRTDKLVRARSAVSGQYLVVLDDAVAPADLAAAAADLARRHHASVLHVYGAALHGFAIRASASDAQALALETRVRFVEEDGRVRAAAVATPGPVPSVLATTATPPVTGAGVDLFVLDTGVRLDHVAFGGRATAEWPAGSDGADCSGHGTWVAGLAAGTPYGVAPGARVRSVRILGCDGAGEVSTLVAGLDFVARNRAGPAVALVASATGPSPALDAAVARLVEVGLPVVAAAGNAGADACEESPARAGGAITVGAVGAAPGGAATPWTSLALSNGGPCVDLLAEGEQLSSAWNLDAASTYAMSGTSGAAARVAGAAALILERRPDATPAQVAAALVGTSRSGGVEDLAAGTPDRVLDAERVRTPGPPDRTAPTTAIVVPAPGATLGGMVRLEATASDDVAVTKVELLVDGAWVGAADAAPYTAPWDTARVANGPHTVSSVAYDAAGNVAASAPVEVVVENPGFAIFDATLGAPRCAAPGPVCDTGPVVLGRGQVGPERNAPNTIHSMCVDGAGGAFHLDESIDAIRISTPDGGALAVGKAAEIHVGVFAYADFAADALDLFAAPDAAAPTWRHLATLPLAKAGAQELVYVTTLEPGAHQAIRAALRFGGHEAQPCTDGLYDDRDDLAFEVADGEADRTPPEVAVVEPTTGTTVGGRVTLAATATDDRGVVGSVEFLVDGARVGSADAPLSSTTRYEVAWDASGAADGVHSLVARAVDGAGNVQDSAPLSFRVGDVEPPQVELVAPAADASVRDVVTLEAAATDDRGVAEVAFLANGAAVGSATAAPWRATWSTAAFSRDVVLVARARDAAGHVTESAPVPVYVDRQPPSVAVTSPQDGVVVSGQLEVVASVSDDRRVRRVELQVDGVKVAEDGQSYPTSTMRLVWNSGTFANGVHALVVVAEDAAGNVTRSAPVSVEVNDATAPSVAISAPADGASFRAPFDLVATVTDDGIVARTEVSVDGALVATDATPPYVTTVDTASLEEREHKLSVTALDGAGNTASREIAFWVDRTPPTAELVAPAAPATVSGTYVLEVRAADAQRVARVDFYLGAAVLGSVAEAPYQLSWDTAAFDNADLDVTAIAYDAAGNEAVTGTVRVTVRNRTTADPDATRGAPACALPASSCFSGTLVESRATIEGRPERGAPNTLDGCPDGAAGKYHVDESVDAITVRTLDGAVLAPGKPVQVDVRAFVVSPELDRVDLYYAANVNDPAWTPIATLAPPAAGLQTLSATYTLPTGPLQAVRAVLRYAQSSASACSDATVAVYDDRDDLVFAVSEPGVDATPPLASIATPPAGAVAHGELPVRVAASDDRGVAYVELAVDGAVVASDTLAPYELAWDSSLHADGLHALTAVAHDTSGNVSTSNPVFVTVSSAPNAALDPARSAPACLVPTSFCDTGALVAGRDTLGPEPYAPSTIASSCPDGDAGAYRVDESIERIELRTEDGRALAPGVRARVDVTVFAAHPFDGDALELYHATRAGAPAWRLLATLLPARAGEQVLSTTLVVPPAGLQALRARFRYGGEPGACGTTVVWTEVGGVRTRRVVSGLYDDHDDVVFAVPFSPNAARDRALGAPRCADRRFYCDSGALLDGRGRLGPEDDPPSTLARSCDDGAAGAYHQDPSVDAIRLWVPDATPLAAGKEVQVEVDVFGADTWASDAVDLWYTADALALRPAWTRVAALVPASAGPQSLGATFVLEPGTVQAVRAIYRDASAPQEVCSVGPFVDHDDLAFELAP
ncbi:MULTISPECIES: Ig-like domain-containing protein [Anaeromyxobacter]|uniref:Ig-like domain-containing protein n=1 Tax=Anaeromyxobacter TaxID=161492 RepID=UPI001F57A672|nr:MULTISPECIES: Ig-like domain-containing protein [unclassified Anaeromyxobacter]